MTRSIARSAVSAALALALGALAYASEPAPTHEGTPGQTKPAVPPMPKKQIQWSPGTARQDTSYLTPPKAEEGRTWVYVSGKLINLYCFLTYGADSESQLECSTARTKGGVPSGLLSQLALLTKKGEIWILFPNHEWAMDKVRVTYAPPYKRLLGWTARDVQAGGWLCQRKGMKGIEVYESALVEPPAGGAAAPDSTSPPKPGSAGSTAP
jgi:hypothetical protein